MISFLRTIPLPIWLLQMVLFFTPLIVHLYLEFELYHGVGYALLEFVWFIYVLPTIIFAYYFYLKGAMISSLILSFIHLIIEWIEHIIVEGLVL